MTDAYKAGYQDGIRDVLEILDDEGSLGNSLRRILALLDAPAPMCPPCNNNCNQGRDCPARKKP